MVVSTDIAVQGVQMLLVLLLAPLLTGFVRKIKARLLRRKGASVFQPYRDLLRLLRKEVALADNASWLFRATPYVTFAAIWVAAALVHEPDSVFERQGLSRDMETLLKSGIFQKRLKNKEEIISAWTEIRAGL